MPNFMFEQPDAGALQQSAAGTPGSPPSGPQYEAIPDPDYAAKDSGNPVDQTANLGGNDLGFAKTAEQNPLQALEFAAGIRLPGTKNKVVEAAFNTVEGNAVGRYVRNILGLGDKDIDLKNNSEEVQFIDSKMAALKAKGGPVDQRLWEELVQRRNTYVNNLNSIVDTANTDHWQQFKNDPAGVTRATAQNLKATISAIKKNPGDALNGFVDGFLQDPELFFAGGGVFNSGKAIAVAADATKLAAATKATNTIVNGFTSIGGSAIKGASMMAPISIVDQLNAQGSVDPATTISSAAQGAVYGVAARVLHDGFGKQNPGIRDISADVNTRASDTGLVGAVNSFNDMLGVKGETKGQTPLTELTEQLPFDLKEGIPPASEFQLEMQGDARAAALAGGSSKIADFVPDEVRKGDSLETQEVNDFVNQSHIFASNMQTLGIPHPDIDATLMHQPAWVDAINKPAAQVESERPTLNISQNPGGPPIFDYPIRDSDGNRTGLIGGIVTPNGLTVVHAALDNNLLTPDVLTKHMAEVADTSLEMNRPINSQAHVTADMDKTFKALKAAGYAVFRSPHAVFDQVRGEWWTKDGTPVYSLAGKSDPNVSAASIDLANTAKGLKKQIGSANIYATTAIAAGVGAGMYGFAKGNTLGDKLWGAFKDAGEAEIGLALLAQLPKLIDSTSLKIKQAASSDVGEGLQGSGRDLAGNIRVLPLLARRLNMSIKQILPDSTNLSLHMLGGKAETLSPVEQQVKVQARTLLDTVGKEALKNGVIENAHNDYFTRDWKIGPTKPSNMSDENWTLLQDNWNRGNFRASRTLGTGLAALIKAREMGLVPKTMDVGETMENYMKSMMKSIFLKKFSDNAKTLLDAEGENIVMSSNKAPRNFVRLSGQLHGYSAHPEVSSEINHLLNYPEPGSMGSAYDAANFGLKRMALGFSLFHPKNLWMNYQFAKWGTTDTAQAFNPNSDMLNQMNHGQSGDWIEQAIRKGNLQLSMKSTPEDFGNEALYAPLQKLSDTMNKGLFKGAGFIPDTLIKAFRLNDKVAFEWNQNYYKLALYQSEFSRQVKIASNRHLVNPDKVLAPNEDQIHRNVGSYVNDLFGSLDYYSVADNIHNKFLKNFAFEALSPSNRLNIQRGVLAPDWTLSVARSFAKMIPGVAENSDVMKMHLRYGLGVAVGALVVANSIQKMTTGKWLWQNDNPGYIDLGDGRKVQYDKQLAEVYGWSGLGRDEQGNFGWNPQRTIQEGLSKMAIVPKTAMELATNKQYISGTGKAPSIYKLGSSGLDVLEADALHIASKAMPITAHQLFEQPNGKIDITKKSATQAVTSFIGFPVYPYKKASGGLAEKYGSSSKYTNYKYPTFKQFEH